VTGNRADSTSATGIPAAGGAVSPVVKDAKDCNADAQGYLKPGEKCQVKCPAGKKMKAGTGISTCDPAGAGTWTHVAAQCQTDPPCDLSLAPTNGNKGTCSTSVAANNPCQQGCSTGYHRVGTTKCGTDGTAKCTYSCDPTCATGNSCIKEGDKSSCTSCAKHYTFTAAKGQKYGTCTLKLGVIKITQAVTIAHAYITAATFNSDFKKQTGFEVAYGKVLKIWPTKYATTIAGTYEAGCTVTSSAAGSRRGDTVISFKATVSEKLSTYAYGIARKPFTANDFKTQFDPITDDGQGTINVAQITKIQNPPTLSYSSASTTSITGFFSLLAAAWCWTQQ